MVHEQVLSSELRPALARVTHVVLVPTVHAAVLLLTRREGCVSRFLRVLRTLRQEQREHGGGIQLHRLDGSQHLLLPTAQQLTRFLAVLPQDAP